MNVQGKHPPIISEQTVKLIIEKNTVKKKQKVNPKEEIIQNMILRGFLYCEHCKIPLTWWPSRNRSGVHYYYYRCFNTHCEHFSRSFNADKVHNDFEDYLKKFSLNHEFIKAFKDTIKVLYRSENDDTAIKQKEMEISWIERRIEKLNTLLLETDSYAIRRNYENELQKAFELKGKIIDNIESIKEDKVSLETINKEIDKYVNSYSNLYKARIEWDDEFKRSLIRVVMGGKIYYNKKTGITTPEISLIYEAFSAFNTSKDKYLEVTRVELVSKSHA